MPQYYTPYINAYPIGYAGFNPYMNSQLQNLQPVAQNQTQYMINVDGENSAKAWQPSSVPQPNTIIPLFDSDGQHVYFKTYDAYGRMNPIRKGRIVFEDEIQESETSTEQDMSAYVTKDDLNQLEERIMNKIAAPVAKTNQNGGTSRSEKR